MNPNRKAPPMTAVTPGPATFDGASLNPDRVHYWFSSSGEWGVVDDMFVIADVTEWTPTHFDVYGWSSDPDVARRFAGLPNECDDDDWADWLNETSTDTTN
jgi:hypothetical protein